MFTVFFTMLVTQLSVSILSFNKSLKRSLIIYFQSVCFYQFVILDRIVSSTSVFIKKNYFVNEIYSIYYGLNRNGRKTHWNIFLRFQNRVLYSNSKWVMNILRQIGAFYQSKVTWCMDTLEIKVQHFPFRFVWNANFAWKQFDHK